MIDYLVTFNVIKTGESRKIIVPVSDKLSMGDVVLYSELKIFNSFTGLGIRSYKDFEIDKIKRM